MFERVLDILSTLGLPGLFAGVFLESLGLPFPGSLLVALAGFLSKQGQNSIVLTWIVAMAGYIVGSVSAFLIGRHIGEPFFRQWGRYLYLTPERFDMAQEWFRKSAAGFIIGGRFIPTVGNVTPYMAGLSNISLIRFLIYDMIHASMWISLFLGAGALLGRNWHTVITNQWSNWVWVIAILIVGLYLFRHYYASRNKNRS